MGLEYFCCFHSYRQKTESLSDHDFTVLFRALMEYSETGNTPELNERVKIAFDFISADIRSTKEKYIRKCNQNKQNRKQALTAVNDRQQSLTVREQSKSKSKSKTKSKSKDIIICSAEQKKNIPLSVNEVWEYAQILNSEKGFSMNYADCEAFIDHHSARGWILNNGKPVKDWQSAFRTWARNAQKWGHQASESGTKSYGGSLYDE